MNEKKIQWVELLGDSTVDYVEGTHKVTGKSGEPILECCRDGYGPWKLVFGEHCGFTLMDEDPEVEAEKIVRQKMIDDMSKDVYGEKQWAQMQKTFHQKAVASFVVECLLYVGAALLGLYLGVLIVRRVLGI